jgi:hypothetical protein
MAQFDKQAIEVCDGIIVIQKTYLEFASDKESPSVCLQPSTGEECRQLCLALKLAARAMELRGEALSKTGA